MLNEDSKSKESQISNFYGSKEAVDTIEQYPAELGATIKVKRGSILSHNYEYSAISKELALFQKGTEIDSVGGVFNKENTTTTFEDGIMHNQIFYTQDNNTFVSNKDGESDLD